MTAQILQTTRELDTRTSDGIHVTVAVADDVAIVTQARPETVSRLAA